MDPGRYELLLWLAEKYPLAQGFWLDGDWPSEGSAYERAQTFELCEEHADRAVRLLRHLRRDEGYHPTISATACWAGDDRVRMCAICGVPLATGGLSEYGIRELLAPEDERFKPDPPELLACGDSMVADHELWPAWEALVRELPGCPEIAA